MPTESTSFWPGQLCRFCRKINEIIFVEIISKSTQNFFWNKFPLNIYFKKRKDTKKKNVELSPKIDR